MAPINPNNTRRYWIDYTVGGVQHTMMFRTTGIYSPASVGTTVNALLNTISALLYLLTINSARTAAAGSDVALPVTIGIEGNTYGSGAPVVDTALPENLTFVGRSSGGHRARFTVYGLIGVSDHFRMTPAENAAIGTMVGLLNTTDGFGLAVDGIEATWYPYANTNVNAYWQRRLRAGA